MLQYIFYYNSDFLFIIYVETTVGNIFIPYKFYFGFKSINCRSMLNFFFIHYIILFYGIINL